MKKFVAILVAAMMLLSGLTAFAGPVEEQAAYISLINTHVSDPDLMIRHIESIDAFDASALNVYFDAIDAAIKVAQWDADLNLVGAQWAIILANFNAIVKALEMSYVMYIEVPTEIAVVEPLDECICVEDGNTCTACSEDGLTCSACGYDYNAEVAYDVIATELAPVTSSDMITGDLEDVVAAHTAAAVIVNEGELEVDSEALLAAVFAEIDEFGFMFYCEENGICIAPNGLLSRAELGLGVFTVTRVNGATGYYAESGLRTWFSNLKTAIAAMAKCNPVAAAPVVEGTTSADRLPDTATSYGNLVVAGIVMMVVAAAAVVGIKKVAFNA